MFHLLGCGKTQGGTKGRELISYSYSSGGGMEGGHFYEEINLVGDEAIYTTGKSEWWYEDNTITEYSLNREVLSEIADIYDKYKMEDWEGKQFSNIFIADGENYSYSFEFDDSQRTYFSSQMYSDKYRSKLKEIDDVIKKYMESAVKLPGLVVTPLTEEDIQAKEHPHNNEINVTVYEYSKNRVYYRVGNGTDTDVDLIRTVKLSKADGELLIEKPDDDTVTVYANYSTEFSLKTEERLEPGKYILEFAGCKCEFEIAK